MASAAEQTITTWISISPADAIAMLVAVYQSPTIAEEKLALGLVTGQVHWDCLELTGKKRDTDPGRGDRAFWRRLPKSAVRWSEALARRHVVSFDRRRRPITLCDYKAVGLVFAREDVIGLLPPAEQARLAEEAREAEALAEVAREVI